MQGLPRVISDVGEWATSKFKSAARWGAENRAQEEGLREELVDLPTDHVREALRTFEARVRICVGEIERRGQSLDAAPAPAAAKPAALAPAPASTAQPSPARPNPQPARQPVPKQGLRVVDVQFGDAGTSTRGEWTRWDITFSDRRKAATFKPEVKERADQLMAAGVLVRLETFPPKGARHLPEIKTLVAA